MCPDPQKGARHAPKEKALSVALIQGAITQDLKWRPEQLPGTLTVTLALTPEDTQRFVFSMESGSPWFGLLPPDESGQPMEPISYAQVVK